MARHKPARNTVDLIRQAGICQSPAFPHNRRVIWLTRR
jgi:hypothetical protein